MNGAESLVRTLVDSGGAPGLAFPNRAHRKCISSCRARQGRRRAAPCWPLFEGVATGMADGYGRMAEKPAATFLHSWTRVLANGLANLHNARRAATPIVNIVGNHATYHAQYDSPLSSDVEGSMRGRCQVGSTLLDQRPFRSGGRRPCKGAGLALAIPRADRNIDAAGMDAALGGSRSSRTAACPRPAPAESVLPRQSLRQRRSAPDWESRTLILIRGGVCA